MTNPVEAHRDDVVLLCRRYGVARLELFGSAATGTFDPARSDLDFLVEFDDNPKDLFKRYFGFKEALEARFGRGVDLVMIGAMRNPYFIESVNRTRQLIYAAADTQAA
jgi:predicted nucleotidyltransferase